MEALNKQFDKELQIIAVSFNNPLQDVKGFITKRKGTAKEIHIPISIQQPGRDTLLEKLFPNSGFPHEVWIDDKGVVKAITNADYVTEENIRRMIDGGGFSLPEKKHQADFSFEQPFLINNNGGNDSAFAYRSLITGYNDSISGFGLYREQSNRYTRLFMANATVYDMLKSAAAMLDTNLRALPRDRLNKLVVVQMLKKACYDWPAYSTLNPDSLRYWMQGNLYCYELILPPRFSLAAAYKKMISDLECYFGIHAAIVQEQVPCLSLYVKDSLKLPYSSGGVGILYSVNDNHYQCRFDNREVTNITAWINGLFTDLPVAVDDTGIDGMLDVDITVTAPYDLHSLQDALADFGLGLEHATRKITVLKLTAAETAE
jgi:hypothetical protein